MRTPCSKLGRMYSRFSCTALGLPGRLTIRVLPRSTLFKSNSSSAGEVSGNCKANFRSAPQVVEGINFIFEQLMTPQLGDTAYGDGQRLVCGAPGDYSGSVEAQFLPDDEAETDAAWIARRIEELVAAGEPVREGSTTRPVPVNRTGDRS